MPSRFANLQVYFRSVHNNIKVEPTYIIVLTVWRTVPAVVFDRRVEEQTFLYFHTCECLQLDIEEKTKERRKLYTLSHSLSSFVFLSKFNWKLSEACQTTQLSSRQPQLSYCLVVCSGCPSAFVVIDAYSG